MRKLRFGLIAALITGLSIGLFAWRDKKYLTADQEIQLYSLGNRFIDAFCHNPSELSEVLRGSFLPDSLLLKAQDFWQEMILTEGECLGHNKADIQETFLQALREIPEEIINADMTTEYGLKDFLGCLVEIENTYYNLNDATRRIFSCIDEHLDIRSVLYRSFVYKAWRDAEPPRYKDSDPIIMDPIPAPAPASDELGMCLDSCFQTHAPGSPEMVPVDG